MDTTAEGIQFDELGRCNFCQTYLNKYSENPDRSHELTQFLKEIKAAGKRKKYDCIVGLSGGVDSSYTLHLVKSFGLRPLAVHMDNGWNSEIATNNIHNLVRKLDVDLYTHVIDWEEYKDLMNSFFMANVIDIELLYDNAMLAVNYAQANKYGIKYILSGSNSATEGMPMPNAWNWNKFDVKNIKAIHGKYGKIKINTLPTLNTFQYVYYRVIKKIKWVYFLDYLVYEKEKAIDLLKESYLFKPYPYKHYESVFTRFYQGYILPRKFNVDKRLVHFSTLICSGQMTREAALNDLKKSPYASEAALREDRAYFLKKMNWSDQKLEDYLTSPPNDHSSFASEKKNLDAIRSFYKKLKSYQ